jgi:hypothetical protein
MPEDGRKMGKTGGMSGSELRQNKFFFVEMVGLAECLH